MLSWKNTASWRVITAAARRCVNTRNFPPDTEPQMPSIDFRPLPFEGLPKDKVKAVRKTIVNPAVLTYYKEPVYAHQGHKQWLFDSEGKRYLDLFAGIVTVGVGHGHPKVVQAAKQQLDKLWHTTNIYMHSKLHEYAEKLVEKLPDDLNVVYLCNSGSEANDLAMLMARLHTGAFDIISLRNAYHGMSPYTMGVTALGNWNHQIPNRFGCHQSINADVYRGPWGGSKCRESVAQVADRTCSCSPGTCMASDKYAEQLEDLLKHSMPKKIAGFMAEYIQGVGGAVQLPRTFLPKAYELIRQKGGICIADEVQTGFGRLGTHFWGFQHAGVKPDIVCMAKSIANGFPMGAVVTTAEVAKSLTGALHMNTYGGNPIGCAAAIAVLDVIEEEKLQERSHTLGGYFLQKLLELRDEFQIIGDVRGTGLMLGVELVEDRETRKPLPAEKVNKLWEDTKDLGILVGKGGLYGSVFRIKPPMCITEDDIDFAIAVLRKTLQQL